MYPSITVQFGPKFTETIIEFIGFDYRNFNSGHCAERHYVDLFTNPNTGEVIICNHGGQWSRETVVTKYPSMSDYRAERDAQDTKMRRLTGR